MGWLDDYVNFMFNMGFSEIVVLGVIALLVIGPKQLPHVARTLARMMNELKRATEDLSSSLKDTKDKVQQTVDHVNDLADPNEAFKKITNHKSESNQSEQNQDEHPDS